MTIIINTGIFIAIGIIGLLFYIAKLYYNYLIKRLNKDPKELKIKEIDEMWYERE